MQPAYKALMHTLLSDSLPDSVWYTAAEAAVTAVYALHPAPQELAQAVVHRQGKVALQSRACDEPVTGVCVWHCVAVCAHLSMPLMQHGVPVCAHLSVHLLQHGQCRNVML